MRAAGRHERPPGGDPARISRARTYAGHRDRLPQHHRGCPPLAAHGGAYWLLDEIAITQPYNKAVAAEDFQPWQLAKHPDRTATLTCDDGNGNVVFTKEIEHTDFPLDEITLYFANNLKWAIISLGDNER
jgi:hypothetical protein